MREECGVSGGSWSNHKLHLLYTLTVFFKNVCMLLSELLSIPFSLRRQMNTRLGGRGRRRQQLKTDTFLEGCHLLGCYAARLM
jgi:hypothetical protein